MIIRNYKFLFRSYRLKCLLGLSILTLFLTGCVRLPLIFDVAPHPVIVQTGCETYGLFDYSCLVWAIVRNDGGLGIVTLEATVYQGGNSWTKTAEKLMRSGEADRIEIHFPEVSLSGGTISYSCRVY